MGIFADFLANAQSIDTILEITPLDRKVIADLKAAAALGDPPRPSVEYDPRNERQTLIASNATGGTFEGSVGIRFNGLDQTIPVGTIAYNESEAGLQTLVDNALVGLVPGYIAGDIDVFVFMNGNIDVNNAQLRYSGDSVKETRHPLGTIDQANLIGGIPIVIERVIGQTNRDVWAIFKAMSLLGFIGDPPEQGGPLPFLNALIDRSTTVFSIETLQALAREAAIQDHIEGLENAILEVFNLPPVQR